ncbi:hypothetical protein [Paenibacillus senegalensis]|uniref:hypothetical protein n=1 Tax=Paenibacillus senegalensis TaxID=1465766 RepID=UPI000289A503|nr:hypothetical protein [Paenibacillus senegalensis]
MLNELITYIQTNPVWSLAVTVLVSLTIWLYKEFKVMIDRNHSNKVEGIQKKLYVYGHLEVVKVIHHPHDSLALNELMNRMGEASSYFSKDIRRISRDFYKSFDPELLPTLLEFINVELERLHQEQLGLNKYDTPTDLENYIDKLTQPLKPIGFIFLIVLVIVFYFMNFFQLSTGWERVSLTAFTLGIVLSGMVFYVLFSLWIRKDLPALGTYRWMLNGTIMLSPFLAFVQGNLSVAVLLIQLIAFVLFIRSSGPKDNLLLY